MVTELLAWGTVTVFTVALLANHRQQPLAITVARFGWVVFASFWATLVPVFLLEMRSPIEAIGAVIAALGCLMVPTRIGPRHGGPMFVLTRAVTVAASVYLIASTVTPVRVFLIETVAHQTHALLTITGVEQTLVAYPPTGLRSQLQFHTSGHTYSTYLVFACTGIGTMAALTGVVWVMDASIRRRLGATTVVIGLVWVSNLLRNAFIAVAFGHQWFQLGVPVLLSLTGYQDHALVSYFVADRLIAQPLSVIAVAGILVGLLEAFPSLGTVARSVAVSVRGGAPSQEVDRRDDSGVGG